MADYRELAVFLPLMAVGLDLVFGDPRWLPHPVRWIGSLANGQELLFREKWSALPLRLAGTLAAMILVGVVASCVYLLTAFGFVGFLLSLYLCSAGLALRCLISETNSVHQLLKHGQLTEAQVALSMLVSRDTLGMNEQEVRRSLAETLSENLNDGFTAPLFWLCVTGPVGMWAYKAVSTLDSMWGYKTQRYREFGWFAARADDVLAWIPARITALAMLLVGAFMRLQVFQAIRHFIDDAGKMESPNAGWPMAAGAWLSGAQMGGLTRYHGNWKHKPFLGPQGQPWTAERYLCLRCLVFWTGALLAMLGQVLVYFTPALLH